jgi:hypothetical protein
MTSTKLAALVAMMGAVACNSTLVGTGDPPSGSSAPSTASPKPPVADNSPAVPSASSAPSAGTAPKAPAPPAFSIRVGAADGAASSSTTTIGSDKIRRADLHFTLPGSADTWTATVFADHVGSGCDGLTAFSLAKDNALSTDDFSHDYLSSPDAFCGLVITATDSKHVAGSLQGLLDSESPGMTPVAVSATFDVPVVP